MMRRSSLIFGDGAACAIVERGDGRSGILASLVEMYPTGSELCEIRAGAHDATLAQVWITTISYFICRARGCSDKPLVSLKIISSVYWKSGLTLADIATVIPHQASHLSLAHMRKRLHVPTDVLVDIYRIMVTRWRHRYQPHCMPP